MYDALNRGLRRASGDICAWLNCDEQYLPGALGKVAEWFLARTQHDILFADAILVDDTGKPVSYRRSCLPTRMHIELCHLNTPSCATFFRKDIFDEGFHFDIRYKAMGDAEWMHRLLVAGKRMGYLKKPMSVFTFTGKNLGSSRQAMEEASAWRKTTDSSPEFLTLLVKMLHRFNKALAGAYLRREVTPIIYTMMSPSRRIRTSPLKVGFGWPR